MSNYTGAAYWSIEICSTPEIGRLAVYVTDRYPRTSVLCGQRRRVFLGAFRTLDEARKAFPSSVPDASVRELAEFLRLTGAQQHGTAWARLALP